jgi:hypothetical protein
VNAGSRIKRTLLGARIEWIIVRPWLSLLLLAGFVLAVAAVVLILQASAVSHLRSNELHTFIRRQQELCHGEGCNP